MTIRTARWTLWLGMMVMLPVPFFLAETGLVPPARILMLGEEFEYTSGCPLTTPVGTMHGEFNMIVSGSGEKFDAAIEPFRLAVPTALN
jgi:uncharacterized protein affecting Mg2+/Co2+ transport